MPMDMVCPLSSSSPTATKKYKIIGLLLVVLWTQHTQSQYHVKLGDVV